MTISILFSVAIYQVTSNEVSMRLTRLQNGIQIQPDYTPRPIDTIRIDEAAEASSHIIIGLVYANVIILLGGGAGSLLLARRTLRPIEEAHEAQSRFTSDASHELRTPLAAMKAELEVTLRDKDVTKKELEDVLKSNLEEVEKLSRLSEMLLNLSRMDHDKLEHTAVNLLDVTNDVIKRFGQPAGRITVSSKQHAITDANEAAAAELVSILVDNALKYSPDDSVIAITLTKHSRQVCFEIINTGAGIDEHKLPHIFDRFYRGDVSRTNSGQQGYGLGLSLAKKIVELHNGELSVTSTPGLTTIFTVLLPSYQKYTSKN
jgi:signal transduction histidine kinase